MQPLLCQFAPHWAAVKDREPTERESPHEGGVTP